MDYAAARYRMVENQVRANRVIDERVISIVSDLPREKFVPSDKADIAYIDEAVKIADGRYLMEPMVMARLVQAAEPRETDVALVIGCGAGYTAAVLGQIVSTVVAVENDSALIKKANEILSELEIDNVAVVEGAFTDGYAKQAPYDVIVFNGAVTDVPETVADQLADGGRLVCVVHGTAGMGSLVLQTRHGNVVSERDIFDCGTPLLPGYQRTEKFAF